MQHCRMCFHANEFYSHHWKGSALLHILSKESLSLSYVFFFTWRGNIHIIFTSSIQWNHHHSSPTINQYKQPLDKLIIKNRRRYIWVKLFIQHLPQKTDCYVVVMQHVNAQVACMYDKGVAIITKCLVGLHL